MIYIAPVHLEAQRRLTTGLASIRWQVHVCFISNFESQNSEQFPSGVNKFQIDEAHKEKLEMRFDCLARADNDDIGLRISQHELDACTN